MSLMHKKGVVMAANSVAVEDTSVMHVSTSFGAADVLLCLPILHYHTTADACWGYTARTACFGISVTSQGIRVWYHKPIHLTYIPHQS